MGQKLKKDAQPKKIQRWEISIQREDACHISLGKCKLKQQGDTTAQILE